MKQFAYKAKFKLMLLRESSYCVDTTGGKIGFGTWISDRWNSDLFLCKLGSYIPNILEMYV